ncbi:MAG: lipopolysaccharide biosynthesis protein [Bacteroidales bacterium]|nr:lipopolysaccharide biosynthesis protein [Bacteroidales bacterium]
MPKSLKGKTIKGIIWSAIGKISINGSNFIVGIILARILTPEDFGITGLVLIFVAISRVFVEGGFSKALVQNQTNSIIDYSTIFFTNICVAIFIYCILFVAAPFIANFYNLPILTNVTRVSALGIIFSAFNVVQRSRMTIKVDFKTQNLIVFSAAILSSLISIFMAYKGFGVWALVFKGVLLSFFSAILYWIIGNWRPIWTFSLKSFNHFFRYSMKIMFGDIINIIYQDFILIVIGKIYGSQILGFYTRAKTFGDSSSINMSQIIQNVSFPILSNLQTNTDSFRKAVRKFIRFSVFISMPISILFLIYAKEIVIVLLTKKWIMAAPLLQILSLIGLFYPLIFINQNILNTRGSSKLYLYSEIVKLLLVIIALIFTFKYSVDIMLYGQLIAISLTYFIYTVFSNKLLSYGFLSQFKDILSIVLLSAIMAFVCYITRRLFTSDFLRLLIGSITGLIIYLGGALLFKFEEVYDFKRILNERLIK